MDLHSAVFSYVAISTMPPSNVECDGHIAVTITTENHQVQEYLIRRTVS